ncbi:MAG: hypothetical protein COT84_07995 [Chlamydiae bacterium CG10_big_fil_rev_8_21_14_0_10_35_9]|nr:MAG: hypothetical protein COT84_07995 [Chlamydiae bacterium CG10_big_fil_rev_8_21_14_0_10_35_9]
MTAIVSNQQHMRLLSDDDANFHIFDHANIGRIPSDKMYAYKCSGIEEINSYLEDMDIAESTHIFNDHKIVRRETSKPDVTKWGATSAIIGGIIGVALFATSASALTVFAVTGGGSGSVGALGKFILKTGKIGNQIEHSRLSRLDRKVNALTQRIASQQQNGDSDDDVLKFHTAKDYFSRTIREYEKSIDINLHTT